jgi:hypothetical protein
MTLSLRPLYVYGAAAAIVLFLMSTPAWSQETGGNGGFTKVGGVAGFTYIPGFTFDGVTFDGETGYKEIGGNELEFLPRLDKQDLIRLMMGYHFRQGSLEVSYDHSEHNGTFADIPMTVKFRAVNVDGRFMFLTRTRVQPHLLLGGSFPWMTIQDSSVLNEQLGDARWRGYGLNAEPGVTVFPHRQFGIGVGYLYRWIWFDRVTGVSDRLFYLKPKFRETSGSVVLSGTVIF